MRGGHASSSMQPSTRPCGSLACRRQQPGPCMHTERVVEGGVHVCGDLLQAAGGCGDDLQRGGVTEPHVGAGAPRQHPAGKQGLPPRRRASGAACICGQCSGGGHVEGCGRHRLWRGGRQRAANTRAALAQCKTQSSWAGELVGRMLAPCCWEWMGCQGQCQRQGRPGAWTRCAERAGSGPSSEGLAHHISRLPAAHGPAPHCWPRLPGHDAGAQPRVRAYVCCQFSQARGRPPSLWTPHSRCTPSSARGSRWAACAAPPL